MKCYYCNSEEHEDIPCEIRGLDSRKFMATSQYNQVRRVHCKQEKYTEYIGRPRAGASYRFGNPFLIGQDGDRKTVVLKHLNWLQTGENYNNQNATEERRQWVLNNLHLITGVLGCWCSDLEYCHGDNLVYLTSNKNDSA